MLEFLAQLTGAEVGIGTALIGAGGLLGATALRILGGPKPGHSETCATHSKAILTLEAVIPEIWDELKEIRKRLPYRTGKETDRG